MKRIAGLIWCLVFFSGSCFAGNALVLIAPGIYAFIANAREPSSDNGGVSANSGVIIGSEGVTVIDPGPSQHESGAACARHRSVR
ncbi:MAG: hypothetical protein EB072_16290 [Betaproteobacteria bacterium]|nr:hypothetical protein [Betaproteobacteria bacterium]